MRKNMYAIKVRLLKIVKYTKMKILVKDVKVDIF